MLLTILQCIAEMDAPRPTTKNYPSEISIVLEAEKP